MTSRPSRLTLRRRLVLFSAPVALIVLIAAVKMISVVVAGNSAVTNFRDGDGDALGGDSSTLNTLNVHRAGEGAVHGGHGGGACRAASTRPTRGSPRRCH